MVVLLKHVLCVLLANAESSPLGQMIANWLMLLHGGRLGEVSPTKLYRQVSQVIPDIAEALWNGDADALSATLDDDKNYPFLL